MPRPFAQIWLWSALLLLATSCAPGPRPLIWYVNQVGLDDPQGQHHWDHSEVDTLDPQSRQVRAFVKQPRGSSLDRAALSPDGAHLAYVADTIWVTDADGSHPQNVGQFYHNMDFFWLDDHRLVTLGTDKARALVWEGEWSLYDLQSRQTRPLTPAPDADNFLCSSDRLSSHVSYVPFAGESSLLGHWQVNQDAIRMVPDVIPSEGALESYGLGCPSWTPDGQQVAIAVVTATHAEEVFLISDRGKNVKQLTHFGGQYRSTPFHWGIAISPDGRWIIGLVALDKPANPPGLPEGKQIALINTETSQVEFLGEWEAQGKFVWSPDSHQVAVSLTPRNADPHRTMGEVHIIDVKTKQVTQVTFDGGLKEVFDWR